MVETQRRFLFEKRGLILQENSAMEFYADRLPDKVNQLLKLIDPDALGEVCRRLFLFHMDRAWSQYLADIADIREGIHWRRFGGQMPVREFIKLAVERFDELQMEIEERCLQTFEQLEVRQNRVDFEKAGIKTPSSTWTYMINDDPFDGILNLQIVGNIGMALGAGLWWPLLFLVSWWKKIKTGKKKGAPLKFIRLRQDTLGLAMSSFSLVISNAQLRTVYSRSGHLGLNNPVMTAVSIPPIFNHRFYFITGDKNRRSGFRIQGSKFSHSFLENIRGPACNRVGSRKGVDLK